MKRQKTKQKNKYSSGFTLVETLVAISIFVMSILGLMSVLSSGIADTGYAKKKMVASYLAQEGIECVRNRRDTEVLFPPSNNQTAQTMWDNVFKPGLPPLTSPSESYCPLNSDFYDYKRYISADTSTYGLDEVRIFSKVEWTQGTGNYSVTFSEDLFNWIE